MEIFNSKEIENFTTQAMNMAYEADEKIILTTRGILVSFEEHNEAQHGEGVIEFTSGEFEYYDPYRQSEEGGVEKEEF